VQVDKEWTVVSSDIGDYAPNGCRFRTASKLGRRILAVCPDASECSIQLPVKSWPATNYGTDKPSSAKPVQTITTIVSVQKLK
jgi:hypothetical protein